LAQQGHVVRAGSFTIFRRGMLGIEGRSGWMYIRAEELHGVPVPADALAAIMIRDDETEAVQHGFVFRVAALLGESTRYYPCPPWSDREREPVLAAEKLAEMPFGRAARVQITGATVRMEGARMAPPPPGSSGRQNHAFSQGDVIRLTIPRSSLGELHGMLAEYGEADLLALLGQVDPAWDAMFAWKHGWAAPMSISAQSTIGELSSRDAIVGGFGLLITHADGVKNEGRLMEDGFMYVLESDTWTRLRQALHDGRPISISSTVKDGFRLEVAWTDN
jgi:hypothetical protein